MQTKFRRDAQDSNQNDSWTQLDNGEIARNVIALDEAGNPLTLTSTVENPSFTISNADNVVASTTVITKTIGGDVYEKTMSYNAAGDTISESVWVQTAGGDSYRLLENGTDKRLLEDGSFLLLQI